MPDRFEFNCFTYSKKFIALKKLLNPRFYGVFLTLLKRGLFGLTLLLMVNACEESDKIGLDLIDNNASLNTLDTLTIRAMTFPDDTVPTNFTSNNYLGVLDDPVFGKTRASIYTETRLPQSELFLGENPELDSLHLVLAYTGDFYGSLGTFQNLQVYELTENFPETDTLFSHMEIPYAPEPITKDPEGFFFRPLPSDSMMVDSVMQEPQIRIPMSDDFAQKFIDANDTEAYETVPNYLDTFKGLYIEVDEDIDGLGSKYQLDMVRFRSALELYYQNDDDTLQQMQRFPINEFAKRINHMERFGYENTHEALKAQIHNQDQTAADSLLFLQSLGMLRVDIHFPFLEDLADIDNLLINKAELIMPVAEGYTSDELPATENISLLRYDEEGEMFFLSDQMEGAGYFGGQLDEDRNRYTFNITRHLQDLIDGVQDDQGLALVVDGASEDASRVVLHGPGRSENPMRLVIHYTVFD